MVNSSYYSSPWFITIFTNSLQQQEDDVVGDRILSLFDYFLTAGWKAIFKMSLYLMKSNEEELLTMSFEHILNFIAERPKQLLSERDHTPEESMHKQIKGATKDMKYISFTIARLEKEFRDSHEASNHQKKAS